MRSFSVAALLAVVGASGANAGGIPVSQCDHVLVKATYNRTDKRFKDWHLATHVDQSTYNEIQKSAGVSAVIYGVPVGASWSEFKKNVASASDDHQESLTTDDFENVAITNLDPTAAEDYKVCIAALRASAGGLSLNVESSTDSDIVISVQWLAKGKQPSTVPISWSSAVKPADATFPPTAVAGAQQIRFLRPSVETSVIVNSPEVGDSASVTLAPLPPPSITPPKPSLAEVCDATSPTADVALTTGDSKIWLCPPLKGGKYLVSFSLGGHVVSDPKGMGVRVTYAIQLGKSNGSNEPLATGDSAGDFDIPAGFRKPLHYPPVIRVKDSLVSIPDGRAYFILNITGVTSQLDSHDGRYASMNLSLPDKAHLERVGD